jgi:pimeloyl-ACP methyl ester carboxylesterase
MTQGSFRRGGLAFDVAEGGSLDGEPVVLLHGFPQTSACWDGVAPLLQAAGYRTVAPDQRGYSPGARPSGVTAYRVDELVADVLALADDRGVERFHLVGHDWGGMVAWALAAGHPRRLHTLSVLATPHPRAFARSLLTSMQLLRSYYMLAFQVPGLPERWLLGGGGRRLRDLLVSSGLAQDRAEVYVQRLLQPGALTAALNWYRALRPWLPLDVGPVTVPTLYVWSGGDVALDRAGAEATARYVNGPYRFEVLEGVSHWMAEEVPDRVGELVLAHLSGRPARADS